MNFLIDKRKYYSRNSTHLFLILPKSRSNYKARIICGGNYPQLLLMGLCLGITLGILIIPLIDSDCYHQEDPSSPFDRFAPATSEGSDKGNPETIKPSKMLRPRFYTTELGLRKKLCVGIVLKDYSNLENLLAINITLTPFVDQLLFFIVGVEAAQRARDMGLTGIVTLSSRTSSSMVGGKLSDVQCNRVGLQSLKYMGDKVLQNYDFFFLGLDSSYINGLLLNSVLNNVSVSRDIFLPVNENHRCVVDGGLMLSHSVLRKLSSRMDRCFKEAIFQRQSEGVKACLQYTATTADPIVLIDSSVVVPGVSPFDVLNFPRALMVGPLTEASQMYMIHNYVLQTRMFETEKQADVLSTLIEQTHIKIMAHNSWPVGLPTPSIPKSRFDMLEWKFFTRSKLFARNEHETEMLLGGMDLLDVSSIVNKSSLYLQNTFYGKTDKYSFLYGYKRFDETRGSNYILHYFDNRRQPLTIECLRPLSNVEVIPMPFVTEGRRVTIIIPAILEMFAETDLFLQNIKAQNVVIVVALILQQAVLPPDDVDRLRNFKQMVSDHNAGFKNRSGHIEITKVGHVLVNMRQARTPYPILAVLDMLSSEILSPSSLILSLDTFAEMTDEFLNRVRMNTILGHQIFSPIPFFEYDPRWSSTTTELFNTRSREIHKSRGYFETDSYSFISFHMDDYIHARKQFRLTIRNLHPETSGVKILSHIFLEKEGVKTHFLRAPEPSLVIPFDTTVYQNCATHGLCFRRKWNSKTELAQIILRQSESQKKMKSEDNDVENHL